jgi:hypothetical protein
LDVRVFDTNAAAPSDSSRDARIAIASEISDELSLSENRFCSVCSQTVRRVGKRIDSLKIRFFETNAAASSDSSCDARFAI